jgi:hypothetical protein
MEHEGDPEDVAIVIDTALRNLTAQQEKDLIVHNWNEWRRQREQEGRVAVG